MFPRLAVAYIGHLAMTHKSVVGVVHTQQHGGIVGSCCLQVLHSSIKCLRNYETDNHHTSITVVIVVVVIVITHTLDCPCTSKISTRYPTAFLSDKLSTITLDFSRAYTIHNNNNTDKQ